MDPFYNVRFADGSVFAYRGGAEETKQEIERFSPGESKNYDAFMKLSEEIYSIGYEQLGDQPFNSVLDMLKVAPDILRLQGLRSVSGLVARYFKDPKLRFIFSFHPLFIGGNPFQASAIFAMITHLEKHFGVWFPMGGTASLVRGLVKLIEGQGSRIRYGVDVKQILIENGVAKGVELADGERIDADIVVSNADAAFTYGKLVDAKWRRSWGDFRLKHSKYSMGLFVWYFGTNRRYDDLAHHTICRGPRYKEHLHDIFNRKVLSEDFSLYLYRPTATDASLAPPGCDTFYVLSPVPNLQGGQDWEQGSRALSPAHSGLAGSQYDAGAVEACRRLACDDAGRFPRQAQVAARRGVQPAAAAGAKRVVPSSQSQRGHQESVPRRRGHASRRGHACRSHLRTYSRQGGARCFRLRLTDLSPPARISASAAPRSSPARKAFYTASKLLPNSVRTPAYGLYAFCRLSDDAIDLDGGSLQALNRLYFRLDRAHRGRPLPCPADRAMADLLAAHAVPVAIPEALLEGLGWDAEGKRYQTIGELHAYAARVASTVGVMMTLLMDVRGASALARACDLGAAMQLTNIARDIGEDARNGRIYLPLEWLDEAEIDVAAFLNDPQPTPALRLVTARLLEEARRLYAHARTGIAELPLACRPAILAASKIYADIGREVAAAGFDSVTRRARTSSGRKLQLLAEALVEAPRIAAGAPEPALPAMRVPGRGGHRASRRAAPGAARVGGVLGAVRADAGAVRAAGTRRNVRLRWKATSLQAMDFAAIVAFLFGVCGWQLYSTSRAKKRRIERGEGGAGEAGRRGVEARAMGPNLYGLIDGALAFGAVVAFCIWQLRSTERAKQQRIAREKAAREKGGGGAGS